MDMETIGKLADARAAFYRALEKAMGLLPQPVHSKQIAAKQLIEEIKATNLPPLEKAALISNAHKIIKEYSNQNNIVNRTVDVLSYRNNQSDVIINLESKKVDEEWISRFFDSGKHVSDEDLQLIWGHILANELSDPGSIPKRLISILPSVEKKHAEAFMMICKHSLSINSQIVPFVDTVFDEEYWIQHNVLYDNLLELQSIGLVTYINFGSYSQKGKLSAEDTIEDLFLEYNYSNHSIIVRPTTIQDGQRTIEVRHGNVNFTSAGMALAKSIHVDYSDEALNHITGALKSNGYKVEVTTLEK